MRGLLILLLLANAAFFVWAQGWLAPALPGPRHHEREPQRLAAQVRPDSVTVLTPQAASAALLAERKTATELANPCLEAGPYTEVEARSAEADFATRLPTGSWQREPAAPLASAAVWLRAAAPDGELRRLLLAERFKPCVQRP